MNNNENNTSNEVNNSLNPQPEGEVATTSTPTENPAPTEPTPVAPSVEPAPAEPVLTTPVEETPAPTESTPAPQSAIEASVAESTAPSNEGTSEETPVPSATNVNEPPVATPEPAVSPEPVAQSTPEPAPTPVANNVNEPPVVAPQEPVAPVAPPVETAPASAPTVPVEPAPQAPEVTPAPVAPEPSVAPAPASAPATPATPQEPTNNDQTIGTIKKEKKSVVPVIIIFVVILGTCVALPYIYGLISPYFEKKNPNPTPVEQEKPNPDDDTPTDPETPTVSDPIDIAADAVITYDNLNVSNIALQEEDRTYYINYTITNNGTEPYSSKDLYIELYNNENTFLGRAKVSSLTSLMTGSKVNLRSEISDAVYSSAAKVNVTTKTEADYPNVTLNENNTLVCRKGIDTITYTFIDNKLTTFREEYNYSIANTEREKYTTDSLKYRNLLNSYINYGAITSFVENETDTESTFTASLTLTLSDTLTSEQKTALKQMNSSIYDKNTTPKVIKFEQEANAYICE